MFFEIFPTGLTVISIFFRILLHHTMVAESRGSTQKPSGNNRKLSFQVSGRQVGGRGLFYFISLSIFFPPFSAPQLELFFSGSFAYRWTIVRGVNATQAKERTDSRLAEREKCGCFSFVAERPKGRLIIICEPSNGPLRFPRHASGVAEDLGTATKLGMIR